MCKNRLFITAKKTGAVPEFFFIEIGFMTYLYKGFKCGR